MEQVSENKAAEVLGSWGEQEVVSSGYVKKPSEPDQKVIIEIDTAIPPVKKFEKFENGKSVEVGPDDPDGRVKMHFTTTGNQKIALPPKAFNQAVTELKDAGFKPESRGIFELVLRTEATNTGKTAWSVVSARRSKNDKSEGPF